MGGVWETGLVGSVPCGRGLQRALELPHILFLVF